MAPIAPELKTGGVVVCNGGRAWDHSLVRALEMMAGHEIAAA